VGCTIIEIIGQILNDRLMDREKERRMEGRKMDGELD
jgi:hypothetical protein